MRADLLLAAREVRGGRAHGLWEGLAAGPGLEREELRDEEVRRHLGRRARTSS